MLMSALQHAQSQFNMLMYSIMVPLKVSSLVVQVFGPKHLTNLNLDEWARDHQGHRDTSSGNHDYIKSQLNLLFALYCCVVWPL